MRVYCLKTCDTCKKAIKALQAAGRDPEVIDVRADGLSDDQRRKFVAELGEQVVNRASSTWRGLSEVERNRDPVALLADYPTLMKRPVIEADGKFYLGWKADVQAALLG